MSALRKKCCCGEQAVPCWWKAVICPCSDDGEAPIYLPCDLFPDIVEGFVFEYQGNCYEVDQQEAVLNGLEVTQIGQEFNVCQDCCDYLDNCYIKITPCPCSDEGIDFYITCEQAFQLAGCIVNRIVLPPDPSPGLCYEVPVGGEQFPEIPPGGSFAVVSGCNEIADNCDDCCGSCTGGDASGNTCNDCGDEYAVKIPAFSMSAEITGTQNQSGQQGEVCCCDFPEDDVPVIRQVFVGGDCVFQNIDEFPPGTGELLPGYPYPGTCMIPGQTCGGMDGAFFEEFQIAGVRLACGNNQWGIEITGIGPQVYGGTVTFGYIKDEPNVCPIGRYSFSGATGDNGCWAGAPFPNSVDVS